MKKTAIMLLLSFVFSFYAGLNTAYAATYSADDDADYPSSKISLEDTWSRGNMCQSFKTERTPLASYVDIMADGTAAPSKYRITLYPTSSGGGPLGPTPDTNPESNIWGDDNNYTTSTMGTRTDPMSTATLRMTRFSNSSGNPIPVTVGQYYWLCMSTSGDYNHDDFPDNPADGIVGWFSDPVGSYPNGYAYSMGAPFIDPETFVPTNKVDFGFTVYTQEAAAVPAPTSTVTPTTTAAPAASTPLPTGVTVGSGAAPATPTAAIKAPTSVTVADVPADQGGSLKLDWKASTTTDITGYKVFRSTTTTTKDFKELVKTEKSVLTYTDNTAAIGQKFYYMVRAYKTTQESASSNIVEAISVDDLAPATPANFVYAQTTNELFNFTWDKNAEADLAGYSFLIVDSEDNTKVIETIELTKDDVAYALDFTKHENLTAASYAYQLVAKDVNANASEKATAEDTTGVPAAVAATPEAAAPTTDWMLISFIALLVIFAGALTYLQIKAKKNDTKISPKLLYTLIGLIIVSAGLIAWRLMPEDAKSSSQTETTSTVPKHEDWPVFESAKNGFKLYHPAEYTVTEGAGGNVSINKGADIIGEIYSYNNDGDEAGMLKSTAALYLDDTKGYMTGGVESSATAAGVNGKRYTGTFGKSAGAKVMVHDAIKGSVVVFPKNDKTWMVFSFDNGNATAQTIFDDMIADMRF